MTRASLTNPTDPAAATSPAPGRSPLFGAVTGLLALDVLLQGLWAGMFLETDGQRDTAKGWITVHNVGGALGILLALVAVAIAYRQLHNRPLAIASAVLAVLLVAEYGIGQAISGGQDGLTPVHIPLALAIMALATWLPVRAGRPGGPARG